MKPVKKLVDQAIKLSRADGNRGKDVYSGASALLATALAASYVGGLRATGSRDVAGEADKSCETVGRIFREAFAKYAALLPVVEP